MFPRSHVDEPAVPAPAGIDDLSKLRKVSSHCIPRKALLEADPLMSVCFIRVPLLRCVWMGKQRTHQTNHLNRGHGQKSEVRSKSSCTDTEFDESS